MIHKIFIKKEPYLLVDCYGERFLVSCDYIRDDEGNVIQMTFYEAKKYAPTRTHYRAIIKEREGAESLLSAHTINGNTHSGYDQLSSEWTSSELNSTLGYYFRDSSNEEYCGVYANVKEYKFPCRKVIVGKEIVDYEVKKYNKAKYAKKPKEQKT